MKILSDDLFIIKIGQQCTFQKSGNHHTSPEYIDTMFEFFRIEAIQNKGESNLSIFFHGGLVDETSGLKTAKNIAPHILNADSHPICFVWETGLLETISTNLNKIGETSFFQKLLRFLLKKISKETGIDIVSGRGNGYGFSEDTIEDELAKRDPFKMFEHLDLTNNERSNLANLEISILESSLKSEIQKEISQDFHLKNELENTSISIYDEKTNTNSRGIVGEVIFIHVADIAYKIIKRFIDKTDHGFFPTIVEEIIRKFYIAELGAWIWKSMKDKSNNMWIGNDEKNCQDMIVGKYFIDKLKKHFLEFPNTKINLIGHSAGSIAICNLIKQTTNIKDGLKFNHIIFLAPACRVELFNDNLLKNKAHYNSIRIFTMTDEAECNDILVPYFYTRSLLYLISGILEDEGISFDAPILGLQRHINFKFPYNKTIFKQIHEYLYETSFNRLCFSPSDDNATDDLRTLSSKHGDFDDDPSTLKSITQILTN